MKNIMNTFENYPEWILKKWQGIADLLAEIISVPAALIMKTENECMEVFISSQSENNPYHVGERAKWYGLYCETVIKTQNKLLIPNATKDKNWDKNPDIKLGMIAYLGFPINFPDHQPFGTLCVLNNKERPFASLDEKLMLQFANVIELDLALMQSFEFITGQSAATVVEEVTERKKMEELLQKQVEELQERDERIRELSTPLVEVWEGVVMLPLIGILDSTRAKQLTESVLERIAQAKTEIIIIDVSGIVAIDTKTASHLLRTMQAVKLMGSEAIITGIRPEVATTLVTLGIDLSNTTTRGTLRQGLEYAYAKKGFNRSIGKVQSSQPKT
jgi:anti-anti-sigma regulatory factor